MKNLWPAVLVIGAGVGTWLVGIFLPKNGLDLLSTAALVSTLGVVIWYTVETRKLRVQQEFDREIRDHPWLKGSSLKVDRVEVEGGGLCGRDIIHLPITNVGVTPAHDLYIKVRWELKSGLPEKGEGKFEKLVLAPNDTSHLNLCEIDYDAPDDSATIEVGLSYKSFTGGGGSFTLVFVKEPGKGWVNGPMSPYEFWLADGRRFPSKIQG